jgi:hypothetical protein
MIYLFQILKTLSKKDLELFESLFSDITFEIDELGYQGNESELVNDMLDTHFGLYLEDSRQLEMLTKVIIDPIKFNSALNVFSIKG